MRYFVVTSGAQGSGAALANGAGAFFHHAPVHGQLVRISGMTACNKFVNKDYLLEINAIAVIEG